jgi:hypothetical protein
MANCAFLGTDENGLPVPLVKSAEDGRYHLLGDLQLPPPLQNKLKTGGSTLLEQSGGRGARIFVLVPLPRYVRSSCCGDGGHVTNRSEEKFFNEILGAEKRLIDAAAVGRRTGEAKVFDLCKLFGSAETPIQDLTTYDGTSTGIWAGDGVHLTSPAYRVAALLLMAELERADMAETGKPVLKRARLESVVPAPVKKAAQHPPLPLKPVATPLWLSGQLPPTTGSQSRDGVRGGYYGCVRDGGGRGGRGRGRGRGRNNN